MLIYQYLNKQAAINFYIATTMIKILSIRKFLACAKKVKFLTKQFFLCHQ